MASADDADTVSSVPDQQQKRPHPALRTAMIRSAILFGLILIVGGALLDVIINDAERPLVATVTTKDPRPVTIAAPARPDGYPDELPTLDKVSMVKLKAEPGAVLLVLVTPLPPADALEMVEKAFLRDGWDVRFSKSSSRLLGAATKKGTLVGVGVSSDATDLTPIGWVTVTMLLERDSVPPPPVVTPPQPKEQTG